MKIGMYLEIRRISPGAVAQLGLLTYTSDRIRFKLCNSRADGRVAKSAKADDCGDTAVGIGMAKKCDKVRNGGRTIFSQSRRDGDIILLKKLIANLRWN